MKKIVVIQNGIDTAYFSEELKDQKDIYSLKGINKDSFVIGFLGRYMPEKGFPVLIDAIDIIHKSQCTNRKIKVLALGWGAYIREYQAYIKEKGLKDYFIFIEFQPDVRWVLRQINLLVIPSLREACPIVPMEGLVSGTPIVASNCIGLREVLKDTPARIFETGSPKDLANAILYKIENPQKTEALNFMPVVKERFDVKSSASKLKLLFDRVYKS